jgi:hypothetical protein
MFKNILPKIAKIVYSTVNNRPRSDFFYLFKGGGGVNQREKVRGAIVHKAESKITTWLTVSPVYKLY